MELCIIPKFHVESHDPEHLDIPHHNIDLRISKSSIKYQNILILLVWARHSKMHHGVFFFLHTYIMCLQWFLARAQLFNNNFSWKIASQTFPERLFEEVISSDFSQHFRILYYSNILKWNFGIIQSSILECSNNTKFENVAKNRY